MQSLPQAGSSGNTGNCISAKKAKHVDVPSSGCKAKGDDEAPRALSSSRSSGCACMCVVA